MIMIALLYGIIVGVEFRYLRLHQRKRRTFYFVIGTAAITFLYFEALYVFRDQYSIGLSLEAIFSPIDQLIVWRR
ncbi:hypothetical protein T458_21360 [Brevibacillus panacihumi W25]|uniref:Uncharacterized protein n=2 Tax=Brevibacillus panacihumi TaxID=497735 RepID=V6M5P9_9BACL|nr:hypothetical protein T458_21360 [Brevibacillus panacihumi W25]